MSKEDLGELAIIVLVLYCILGAILTYPALVVGYYFDKYLGIDVGFYAWLISMGILVLLKIFRAYVFIGLIYLISFIPFIFICIEWWRECYSC